MRRISCVRLETSFPGGFRIVANLMQVALNDAHDANFKSFQQPVRQIGRTKEGRMSDSTIDKELEPMKVFETQSGLARLLIYIYLRGLINVSNVIDIANIHEHAVYPSIKKATGLGLITSDFDPESPHRARRLELTDRGKYITKRLDEINNALSGK